MAERPILLVGGTGFVGKTLAVALQAAGRAARIVSRQPDRDFQAAHAPSIPAHRLEAVLADPGPVLSGLSGCVYLASAGRLGDHRDSPWDEAERMLSPLMRMLYLLSRHAPVPVVYLSSAALYGPRPDGLLQEDMDPRPVTPYGTGKAMAETALAAAGRQGGFPTRVLRPSTPIGRWQAGAARGAVGALIDAAAGGQPFTLNGDGSAVRDFFDARDLAAAILAALDCDLPGHRVWNAGAGTGTALIELIALVEEVTGRPVPLHQRPMPPGEVARAVLDTTRIQTDLGWSARISLPEALADIWAARG